MAEGDTILRAARRLDEALAGQKVEARSPHPRGSAAGVERLDGRTLDGIETRGKHLLLRFGDLVLHSHLGMSGAWHVYERDAAWRKAPGTAWAVLRGADVEAVEFGGPTLRLLKTGDLRIDPVLSRLGPDVLAPDFDAATVATSLRLAQGCPIGEALLNQGLIAGVGNIFKSEVCFVAKQDPWQAVDELSEEQLRHVVSAARDLMRDAAHNGRRDRAVYRRAGRPCPNCGTSIRSRGQGDANRITYWCPVCQARAAGNERA